MTTISLSSLIDNNFVVKSIFIDLFLEKSILLVKIRVESP